MRVSIPRRPYAFAALASLLVLSLSCGGDSGDPSPSPTTLIVSPGLDTMVSVGEVRTFGAQVLDADGEAIPGAEVTWASSDSAVLQVIPTTGVATALKNGTASVTAVSGDLDGSATVFVVQLVTSVTVTPTGTAFTAVGDTLRFSAAPRDSGGTLVADAQVIWSVNDNTVATVDTLGLVRAKGPGTAIVTALAQTRAGHANVGVAPAVTGFAVLAAPTTAIAGEAVTTALVVELRDARGNRVTNASVPVSVAPGGAAHGTPLHGTTTVLSDEGRATFTGLWFEKAGAGRFIVTVGALPADSSAQLAVAPAAPASIELDPIGVEHVAGVPLGILGRVRDRFRNLATNFSGDVRVELLPGFDPGPLYGDSVVAADSGVAAFTDLHFRLATDAYRVVTSLVMAATIRDTSPPLVVLPSTPAIAMLTTLGGVHAPFPRFTDTSVVTVTDSFQNPIADGLLSVYVRPIGWPFSAPAGYGLALIGDTVVDVIGGRALFQLGATRPGPLRLIFETPGFAPDTTPEIVTTLPVPVGGSALAMDAAFCVAAFFCSGGNGFGQLGVDPGVIPVDSLFVGPDSLFGGNVLVADGGARHACAIVDRSFDYVVRCWGDNGEGQSGGPVGGASHLPVVVPSSPHDVIAAGGAHTCVGGGTPTLCWGRNDQGQLGDSAPGASTGTPKTVVGGHTFFRMSAGGRHTCGIDFNFKAWCWGANDFGQLGAGLGGASYAYPVPVAGDSNFVEIVAGEDFTCALSPQGLTSQVFCWGRNDFKQVDGIEGGASSYNAPIAVPTIVGQAPLNGRALVAGARFACVTLEQTQFYTSCWGANGSGQLGYGAASAYELAGFFFPPIGGYSGYADMVAGAEYVCGRPVNSETAWVCWGRNDQGQLGSGTTSPLSAPIVIRDQY